MTDFKSAPRVKDPALFKWLHAEGVHCVLCGYPAQLHHLIRRSQRGDDVPANLIGLCAMHHTALHAGDRETRKRVGACLSAEQIAYVQAKIGDGADDWLLRHYGVTA